MATITHAIIPQSRLPAARFTAIAPPSHQPSQARSHPILPFPQNWIQVTAIAKSHLVKPDFRSVGSSAFPYIFRLIFRLPERLILLHSADRRTNVLINICLFLNTSNSHTPSPSNMRILTFCALSFKVSLCRRISNLADWSIANICDNERLKRLK